MIADMAMSGTDTGGSGGMNILMIEDNPADFRLIEEMLRDANPNGIMTTAFKLGHVDRLSKGLEILSKGETDVVLLDLSLPDSQGIDTVVRTHSQVPDVPIVVVSGSDDDAIARQAMAVGAREYLFKGRIDGAVLMKSMRDSVRFRKVDRELTTLRSRTEMQERHIVELERSNEALDAFAYTVSHELRAPIRAMEGFARALIEDFGADIDPTAFDYADRIIDSAKRMDTAVQDLLQYCRTIGMDTAIEHVDLDVVMVEAMAAVAEQERSGGATVTIDPDLPIVRGNHASLVMVMANLLSNAMKFVDPKVEPRVKVRAESTNDTVRIWVEDNGIGIRPDHAERVFEPFERLNGGQAYPGTGIGLAIVEGAVSRIGGQVGVESKPGQGSRFWVELPRAW